MSSRLTIFERYDELSERLVTFEANPGTDYPGGHLDVTQTVRVMGYALGLEEPQSDARFCSREHKGEALHRRTAEKKHEEALRRIGFA